jgi:hypothetical protein
MQIADFKLRNVMLSFGLALHRKQNRRDLRILIARMREIHAECVKIFRITDGVPERFVKFQWFLQKNLLALPVLKNFLNNVLTVFVI